VGVVIPVETCLPQAGGNPGIALKTYIPASAGMTKLNVAPSLNNQRYALCTLRLSL